MKHRIRAAGIGGERRIVATGLEQVVHLGLVIDIDASEI